MSKVVVAGGTGFVGRELCALLVQLGYEVVVLSRSPAGPRGTRVAVWDGETQGEWAEELNGAKAVVNLTGSPISVKWTPNARLDILQSRLKSANAIAEAIRSCEKPPEVWVNAGAIGYYGDRGSEELDESAPPGRRKEFLVDTSVAWEAAQDQADVGSVRKKRVRIGIVLGKDGGALPPLANLARWFLGGQVGSGSQYVSWIHVRDLARLFVYAIEHDTPAVMNGTSPTPASNAFFMGVLRGVLGRPWAPPVPAFALTVANWLGAPDPSLLLWSQRAIPKAALDSGFQFEFTDLRDTLSQLLR